MFPAIIPFAFKLKREISALRRRFLRLFRYELKAAHDENSIFYYPDIFF